MKYDFDEIVPRRGTNAIKWDMDTDPEVLPMWVADMDFRTAPAVAAALQRRVQHDIFGYATAPKAYYDAITGGSAAATAGRYGRNGCSIRQASSPPCRPSSRP